jgi:4-carboxymuconolactone decarboxylase
MTGTAAQLRFHFGAAMNAGWSAVRLRAFIGVLDARIGQEEAAAAAEVLLSVLGEQH